MGWYIPNLKLPTEPADEADNAEPGDVNTRTQPSPNDIDFVLDLIKDTTSPKGFRITSRGISVENDDGSFEQFSTTPILVYAEARNPNQECWKAVLKGIDRDGKCRDLIFDRSELRDPKIANRLLDYGFDITVKFESCFREYINGFLPELRFRSVPKLGWYDNDAGRRIFVLPDNTTLGEDPTEMLDFRPDRNSPSTGSMFSKGTFLGWQKNIAKQTEGNPLIVFCLSTAFAGPLLKLLGGESGGFNIFGTTSQGKTTALQVAASVWGNGASPTNTQDPTFMRTWGATSNALEGIAAAHNDTLMVLDELAQCDAKDFQKIVYDLAGGQGKARMTKTSSLQETSTWRLVYLSSGEIPAKMKMEEGNRRAKAGQMLRLMDIPITGGVITDPHGNKPGQFADALKNNCQEHFGHAGPAFVKRLIDKAETSTDFLQDLTREWKTYRNNIIPEDLEAGHKRALSRLALVGVAGSLACQLDILPFEEDEVERAILHVRDTWIQANQHISDAARAVQDIRDYVNQYEARFAYVNNNGNATYNNTIHNKAGYRYVQGDLDLFLFYGHAFKEACNGVPVNQVATKLKDLGFLHTNNPGKNKARLKVSESGKEAFYAVKATIKEDPTVSEEKEIKKPKRLLKRLR